jgi:hypothetical protein
LIFSVISNILLLSRSTISPTDESVLAFQFNKALQFHQLIVASMYVAYYKGAFHFSCKDTLYRRANSCDLPAAADE